MRDAFCKGAFRTQAGGRFGLHQVQTLSLRDAILQGACKVLAADLADVLPMRVLSNRIE